MEDLDHIQPFSQTLAQNGQALVRGREKRVENIGSDSNQAFSDSSGGSQSDMNAFSTDTDNGVQNIHINNILVTPHS